MAYKEYIDAYLLKKNQIELFLLESSKGPKPQSQKLEMYEPDEIIIENSETDEISRAQSPIQKPQCYKALKANNVRVCSQSENLRFSAYHFLSTKQQVPKQ